jgi:hypothetical protein
MMKIDSVHVPIVQRASANANTMLFLPALRASTTGWQQYAYFLLLWRLHVS